MQTIKNNQSLFDITLQEYGDIRAVFELALLNDISWTDILFTGMNLEVPISKFSNQTIKDYYARENIELATFNCENQETSIMELILMGVLPLI